MKYPLFKLISVPIVVKFGKSSNHFLSFPACVQHLGCDILQIIYTFCTALNRTGVLQLIAKLIHKTAQT